MISTSRTLLVSVRSPLSHAAGALKFRALQGLSACPFSGYAGSSQRYEYTFPSFCDGQVPKPGTGFNLTRGWQPHQIQPRQIQQLCLIMRRQRSHVMRRDVAVVSDSFHDELYAPAGAFQLGAPPMLQHQQQARLVTNPMNLTRRKSQPLGGF